MTLTMPCSACGFTLSARSNQALVAAYFDHQAAVHPIAAPKPSLDALAKLVATMQGRRL